jgi:hypothetical protein
MASMSGSPAHFRVNTHESALPRIRVVLQQQVRVNASDPNVTVELSCEVFAAPGDVPVIPLSLEANNHLGAQSRVSGPGPSVETRRRNENPPWTFV